MKEDFETESEFMESLLKFYGERGVSMGLRLPKIGGQCLNLFNKGWI